MDGIGRILLEDGTDLKVGTGALKSIVSFAGEERPLVGVRVVVSAIAPHPLGGFRATEVKRAQKEVSFARLKTVAAWEKALKAVGLAPRFVQALSSSIRVGMRIVPKRGRTALGASKLGGAPDLPKGFVWPDYEGRPMAFVGQLRLAEISPAVRADLRLPKQGLISFFVAAESEPAQADGASGGCAVVLFDAASKLVRMDSDAATFEERSVSWKELVLPPPVAVADKLLDDDAAAMRLYGAALSDHDRALGEPAHWVGGHPWPVQDPPESEGERLLLQIDSDDELGMQWSDMGRLYFMLRPDRGLSSARCELQST